MFIFMSVTKMRGVSKETIRTIAHNVGDRGEKVSSTTFNPHMNGANYPPLRHCSIHGIKSEELDEYVQEPKQMDDEEQVVEEQAVEDHVQQRGFPGGPLVTSMLI